MAETVVFGCDWCDAIVPKNQDGSPRWAATITSVITIYEPPPAHVYNICADCVKAFRAVRMGKFRR